MTAKEIYLKMTEELSKCPSFKDVYSEEELKEINEAFNKKTEEILKRIISEKHKK